MGTLRYPIRGCHLIYPIPIRPSFRTPSTVAVKPHPPTHPTQPSLFFPSTEKTIKKPKPTKRHTNYSPTQRKTIRESENAGVSFQYPVLIIPFLLNLIISPIFSSDIQLLIDRRCYENRGSMEDDDEIQSHLSPRSGSPASPRPVGRITVTVAAAPPLQHSPAAQNTLTLALPIQQTRNGSGGGGGGREDCWSEGATAVLIEAWGERYLELSRGNLKQKHWKEVADIVSIREDYTKTPKTDIQCKNRIDTVKKKYKLEKAKIAAGGGPSKWPFYDRLDHLIGPAAKISGSGSHAVATLANAASQQQAQKVPLGIPVGVRGASPFHGQQRDQKPQLQLKNQKIQFKRRGGPVDSGSSREASPASTDSFPFDVYERKRPRTAREMNMNMNMNMNSNLNSNPAVRDGGRDKKGWGSAVKELTQAILKFGEAYEQAESSKLQQVVEMEKQRMKFAKDLELQRMQFFMKTQLEISQLKHGRRGGGIGNASNHHSNNNNNNSDSSN